MDTDSDNENDNDVNLTGFLFGNIDSEGRLEDDIFDNESKQQLAALARYFNIHYLSTAFAVIQPHFEFIPLQHLGLALKTFWMKCKMKSRMMICTMKTQRVMEILRRKRTQLKTSVISKSLQKISKPPHRFAIFQ